VRRKGTTSTTITSTTSPNASPSEKLPVKEFENLTIEDFEKRYGRPRTSWLDTRAIRANGYKKRASSNTSKKRGSSSGSMKRDSSGSRSPRKKRDASPLNTSHLSPLEAASRSRLREEPVRAHVAAGPQTTRLTGTTPLPPLESHLVNAASRTRLANTIVSTLQQLVEIKIAAEKGDDPEAVERWAFWNDFLTGPEKRAVMDAAGRVGWEYVDPEAERKHVEGEAKPERTEEKHVVEAGTDKTRDEDKRAAYEYESEDSDAETIVGVGQREPLPHAEQAGVEGVDPVHPVADGE
jgi:hypothetical protein